MAHIFPVPSITPCVYKWLRPRGLQSNFLVFWPHNPSRFIPKKHKVTLIQLVCDLVPSNLYHGCKLSHIIANFLIMLSSFFRRIATVPKTVPVLTVYHNTQSKSSTHLVNKLRAYANLPSTAERYSETSPKLLGQLPKFVINLKENQLPTFEDYAFVHENCLGIHPGNLMSFQRLFPRITGSSRFAGDLEFLSESEYSQLVSSNRSRFFKPPLIIDHANSLIAHDDAGLDRIMANYLSCGIQDSHKNLHLEDDSSFQHIPHTSANTSQEVHRTHHINPHVAEFADLY